MTARYINGKGRADIINIASLYRLLINSRRIARASFPGSLLITHYHLAPFIIPPLPRTLLPAFSTTRFPASRDDPFSNEVPP